MAMINDPIGGGSLLPSYFLQNPDNNAMMPPGTFFNDGSMGPSPTDYANSVTSQLGGTDVSTMGGPGSNVSTTTNSGNTSAGTFGLPANYYSTGSFDPSKQLYPNGLINNQSSAQSQYGWIDPQQARAAGLAANAKQNATPPQGSTATADPSIFITPQGRVWVTGAGEGISAPDPMLESRLFPNGRPQGAPGPMVVPPPLSNTYSQTAGGGGQQTAPPPATAPPPPGGAGAGTPAGGGNSDFINQLYQMITGQPAGGYQPQQQRFAPFQGYGGGYGQRGGFGQQIGNPAFTGYGMQSPQFGPGMQGSMGQMGPPPAMGSSGPVSFDRMLNGGYGPGFTSTGQPSPYGQQGGGQQPQSGGFIPFVSRDQMGNRLDQNGQPLNEASGFGGMPQGYGMQGFGQQGGGQQGYANIPFYSQLGQSLAYPVGGMPPGGGQYGQQQNPYQQAGNVYGQQFNVPRLGNTMQNPFSSAYGAALQPYGGSQQNNYGSQISNMIAQAFGQGGMGGQQQYMGGGSSNPFTTSSVLQGNGMGGGNQGYGGGWSLPPQYYAQSAQSAPTQGYGGYQGGYF